MKIILFALNKNEPVNERKFGKRVHCRFHTTCRGNGSTQTTTQGTYFIFVWGILIILQDAMAWSRLRPTVGKYQIYYYYFKRWSQLGIIDSFVTKYIDIYATLKGSFTHMYTDTSLIKNKHGTDNLGRNPCDRGRPGNKIAVLCDDFKIPLSLIVFTANFADQNTVIPLFEELSTCVIDNSGGPTTVAADRGYTATDKMTNELIPYNARLIAPLRRLPDSEEPVDENGKPKKPKKKKPKDVKKPKKPREPRPELPKEDQDKLKKRYLIGHFNSRFKQFKRLDKRYERKCAHFKNFLDIMRSLLLIEAIGKMA